VLGPLVAKRFLGGAAAWGAIVASEGAGLLLGGVLVYRLRPSRPLFVGTAALGLTAIPLVFLASVRSTAAVAAAFLLAGIALEFFNVAWATALQQHVPLDKLSRVSAYDMLGSLVLIPLGLSIAGPIADAIGLEDALWLAAAVAGSAMLSALAVRDVRELRRRDDVPPAGGAWEPASGRA
jgi:predicted MFS family arabinose efflux permease